MKVERLVVGPIRTNCYLIINEEQKTALVIDPGDDPLQIQNKMEDLGVHPVAILLTHGHFDHILAVPTLMDLYAHVDLYADAAEENVLDDPGLNCSNQLNRSCALSIDHFVKDGDQLTLAGFQVQVISTPGHTEGSCCYYFPEEGLLFSGDTLFAESVGRTDLPTGSMGTLSRSLKKLLSMLPDETVVYPGHEQETTIGHEKRYNPFA